MEVCSPVNQLRKGGLEGWCVTMNGVLLVLCFGLYCSAWDLEAFFCSRSGFPDVLRVMAVKPEVAFHLVTAAVEDVSVRAEASQPQELVVGISFSRIDD